MTCKDCIHYDGACINVTAGDCMHFKDKSRFIELPCNVGADIFYPAIYSDVGKYIHFGKVVSFSVDSVMSFYARYDDGLTFWHRAEDIGETVFLSREEAEKALKEREKEE